MPSQRAQPRLLTLRIALWHARPVVLVLAALLGAALVVRGLAPAPPPTRAVLVAARALPAGTELTEADLRTAALPLRLVPDEALGPDDVPELTGSEGRRTAVALPAGMTVVESLLAGERFGVEPPDGSVVVPVRLAAAAVAGLLRVGDRIDLVAPDDLGWAEGFGDVDEGPVEEGTESGEDTGDLSADPTGGPEVLARGALVLDVGQGSAAPGSGDALDGLGGSTGLGGSGTQEQVTLVAVTPQEGQRLASAALRDVLGAVLVE